MTNTPSRRINSKTSAQAANFAKSLPIEIANSPLNVGRSYMATLESDDDVSISFIHIISIKSNINFPIIFVYVGT